MRTAILHSWILISYLSLASTAQAFVFGPLPPELRDALDHHRRAQSIRREALSKNPAAPDRLERARSEYSQAADGYQRFLSKNTSGPDRYGYTFLLAECLFHSLRLREAATEYEKVRDWPAENEYLHDAAFNAVKAREQLLNNEIASGSITLPPIPGGLGKTAQASLASASQDTSLVRQYLADCQALLGARTDSAKADESLLRCGEVLLRYQRFGEARSILSSLVRTNCSGPLGLEAAQMVALAGRLEGRTDIEQEWSGRASECAAVRSIKAH